MEEGPTPKRRRLSGSAASDTTGSVGDTTESAGDTTRSVGDTTGSVGDTTGSVGDTSGSVGDTTGSVGDTTGSAGDTTRSVGDTTGSVGDTTGSVGDTTVVESVPGTSQSCNNLIKTGAINAENVTISGGGDNTFDNIVASTRNSIKHIDHSKHVQTRAEKDIPGILQKRKCVFIKGISGSGKTRLGLNILAKVAEETGRVPFQLTSSNNWDLIPKSSKQGKYVVMIDDIFGPCTLIQSYVDEWKRLFDMMWPEVDKGHVLLVVLSRPEIHASCQHQLKKYKLFENIHLIDLDKGEFALDEEEKREMLETLCNKYLFKMDMSEIVSLEMGIGFPQCCRFFSNSQEAQKLGVEFFRNPTLYILQEINTLHERDGLGYLVLLVLLMKDGKLLNDELSFRPKPEFKSLVFDLRECISTSIEYPTMNQLKQKAISLCGVFFLQTEDGFEFQHQSISDAAFVSISFREPSICMEKCTPRLLVNYVRHCKVDSQTVVTVPIKQLVNKITSILLGEDYEIVLDHPCLFDDDFARYVVEHWQETLKLKTILEIKHEQKSNIKCSQFWTTFHFSSLFASLVLKKAFGLVEQLLKKLDSMSSEATISSDALTCSIHVENSTLIRMLLQHVEPTEESFRVLCFTSNVDSDIIDRIFASMENKLKDIECIYELLTESACRGNTYLVKLLVDKLGSSDFLLKLYSQILQQIMGTIKMFYRFNTDLDSNRMEELVRTLLATGCDVSKGRLVWMAAAHPHAGALRALLEDESVCITEMYEVITDTLWKMEFRVSTLRSQRTTPLHQASLYGSIDCLKLLLDRNIGNYINTKSSCDGDKEQSFTPLHYAAMRGRVEHMELLLSKGADVSSKTSHGRTPLSLSMHYGQIAGIGLLLQKKVHTDI